MALAGVAAGTVAQAGTHRTNHSAPLVSHTQRAPSFPKNARGQSYGSSQAATSDDQVPDLVQAYATNGHVGFIRKDDLIPESPRNPEQAIQANAANARASVIPVYAADGVTRIGDFVMQPGTNR
jgi:hypothetical protein